MGHTVEYVCAKECGWANATHYADLPQENEQGPEKCPNCGAAVKHLGARHDGNRNLLTEKEPAEEPVVVTPVQAPEAPKKKAPRKARTKPKRKR